MAAVPAAETRWFRLRKSLLRRVGQIRQVLWELPGRLDRCDRFTQLVVLSRQLLFLGLNFGQIGFERDILVLQVRNLLIQTVNLMLELILSRGRDCRQDIESDGSDYGHRDRADDRVAHHESYDPLPSGLPTAETHLLAIAAHGPADVPAETELTSLRPRSYNACSTPRGAAEQWREGAKWLHRR